MANTHLWIITLVDGSTIKYANVQDFTQLIQKMQASDKLSRSDEMRAVARVERV